jgi:hypothetical protein
LLDYPSFPSKIELTKTAPFLQHSPFLKNAIAHPFAAHSNLGLELCLILGVQSSPAINHQGAISSLATRRTKRRKIVDFKNNLDLFEVFEFQTPILIFSEF